VVRLGEVVMIIDLHRQGVSVSAIARQTGLDRKTMRRYIERGRAADGGVVLTRAGDLVAQRSLEFYDAVARRLAQENRA